MMKKHILVFFISLVCFPSLAQDHSKKIEKADSIVQAFVNEKSIPGMAISVYLGNEMIWSKGYGYSDLKNQVPVDPSKTKFRIGSVSKTLTASALGVLMQEGKVDPDQTIQTYVPHFPVKNWPITVRQVAGHTAGIRHYNGSEFMSRKKYETINEGLEIFKGDPLLFEPGTSYHYSSYGWNLISAVVEGASGYDFLPYINSVVFDHLGMNHTEADWADKDIPNRTKFYEWSGGRNKKAPYVDNSYKWAGGGFIGTTEDLILFGEAHLDYDYLNEETQQELMFPQQTSNGETTDYGMGWSYLQHNDTHWIGHSGGSVGGSTMFLINKRHRMVIAYAINRSRVGFDNLHFKIADVFLNTEK